MKIKCHFLDFFTIEIKFFTLCKITFSNEKFFEKNFQNIYLLYKYIYTCCTRRCQAAKCVHSERKAQAFHHTRLDPTEIYDLSIPENETT